MMETVADAGNFGLLALTTFQLIMIVILIVVVVGYVIYKKKQE